MCTFVIAMLSLTGNKVVNPAQANEIRSCLSSHIQTNMNRIHWFLSQVVFILYSLFFSRRKEETEN